MGAAEESKSFHRQGTTSSVNSRATRSPNINSSQENVIKRFVKGLFKRKAHGG